MKVRYFYDAQTERVIKHLVRAFNEFQVVSHTVDGKAVYKKVPCRYYDYSRQALYMINKGSENILQSAPFITISIDDLQLDRKGVRSPTSQNVVTGVNAKNEDGEYVHELSDTRHVTRFNPVPWDMKFSVNIWTTTHVNKLELFEQIVTLCNPSVTLQLSNNPIDWTSQMTIELDGTDWSNKSFPAGESTRDDLELTVIKFKTTIWYSLPALDTRANLINAIQAKIASIDPDEYNDYTLDFDNLSLSTDVYTPNNYKIQTSLVTGGVNANYDIKLLTKFGRATDDDGNILLWEKYFQFFDIDYETKQISIRLSTAIEDGSPLTGIVKSIDKNIIRISIDMSSRVKYTINGFVGSIELIDEVPVGQNFISLVSGEYKNIQVKENVLYSVTADGISEITDLKSADLIYCADDELCYIYSDDLGWHGGIYKLYKPGFWKIGFTEI